jgi:hypothetical protein
MDCGQHGEAPEPTCVAAIAGAVPAAVTRQPPLVISGTVTRLRNGS